MPSNKAIFAAFHRPPTDFKRAHDLVESMDSMDRQLLETYLYSGIPECDGAPVNDATVHVRRVLGSLRAELN